MRSRHPQVDDAEPRTDAERPLENDAPEDFDPSALWPWPRLPVSPTDGSTAPSAVSEPKVSDETVEAQSVSPTESPKSASPTARRLRITQRDQALFRQLARTGVAARQHILEGAQLTAHRLDTLTHHGYLERRNHVVRGCNVRVYSLTLRGQRKLKQTGFGLIYRRNSRQIPHDLKLTSIYYKLPPNVRESWRHEGDLIRELRAQGIRDRGYCVDAAVLIDGQSYGVEALSHHYKPHEIEAKQQFIQDFFDGRGIVL